MIRTGFEKSSRLDVVKQRGGVVDAYRYLIQRDEVVRLDDNG